MWWIFFVPALAGELVVDARVPVEVRHQGQVLAQLFQPAVLKIPLPTGPASIELWQGGSPSTVDVVIPHEGSALLLVGKTGVTTNAPPPPPADVERTLEIRGGGPTETMVVVGTGRYPVAPGRSVFVPLAPGDHRLQVRSVDGTVIWAQGTLALTGGGPVILAVAEGRFPELSGEGALLRPLRP